MTDRTENHDNDTSQPPSPFLVERLMREARRHTDGEEFASEEEFRGSLPDFIAEGLPAQRLESLRDDPEELAQEFAFEAYEADEEQAALELVDKALLVDPDCVDALAIRAFITSEDAGELIAGLEHAATRGERRLGEEFFAEFMGDFWPMVEARPYMRTIKHLAEVLWNVGRRLDAIDHYENLLDLDPSDHMGNSTLLLGYYLSMGEVQRSWDLLEEYDDEAGAVYSWAWVLLFLMTGDEEAAHDALEHALNGNPHVAPWLLGIVEEPAGDLEDLPAPVVAGSEEEARLCAGILDEAWARSGPARFWLHEALVDLGLLEAETRIDEQNPPAAP
jgi:tetratricopeptide (TPR) repeat protein